MTENTISAFKIVKDQVSSHACKVLLNASGPLILYTYASTKVIGEVLMQVQGGREKPCIFNRTRCQSRQLGEGDGARTLCFRALRQKSCSLTF